MQKVRISCRSRIILQNEDLLATDGLDKAENEASELFEIRGVSIAVLGVKITRRELHSVART